MRARKRRRRVGFYTPLFTTYGSLKAAYNRLPILSPQQTPYEAGGAERALREKTDLPKVTQLAACAGGVENRNRISRLEATALNHYPKLAFPLRLVVAFRVCFFNYAYYVSFLLLEVLGTEPACQAGAQPLSHVLTPA